MKKTILSFFPSLTFFLTSLTLLFATAAQAQVPSYVPTNGLVGYWPFNGNANDESGNGYNGTITGTSFVQDRLGNQSAAMEFMGSTVPNTDNTVVAIDQGLDILNFNYQFTQELSVSMWANTLATTNGDVLNKRTNNDIDFVCTLSASNSTYFHLGPAGSVYDDLTTVPLGEWHLYTYVFEFGQMRTYVDGQLVSEALGSATLNNNTNYITIGKYVYYGGNTHYFFYNGILDDIGIWNRALTADEVLALYNSCNVAPQVVTGSSSPSSFANSTYTCVNNVGSTYNWTVNNGTIVNGQGTNSIEILWGTEGMGSVTVAETTADGCLGDVMTFDVVIIPNSIEELSNAMILYPNPATTNLTLQVKNEMIGSDFVIYDALGKVVLRDKIRSTNQNISVISLSNGNYILRVGAMNKVFTISK